MVSIILLAGKWAAYTCELCLPKNTDVSPVVKQHPFIWLYRFQHCLDNIDEFVDIFSQETFAT